MVAKGQIQSQGLTDKQLPTEPHIQFYMGARDPTSSPHARTVSTPGTNAPAQPMGSEQLSEKHSSREQTCGHFPKGMLGVTLSNIALGTELLNDASIQSSQWYLYKSLEVPPQ